jgi:hypothetical protein
VRLASGDASGLILVWDVPQCRLISSMQGVWETHLFCFVWIGLGFVTCEVFLCQSCFPSCFFFMFLVCLLFSVSDAQASNMAR